MSSQDEQLEKLVEAVLASSKYREISPELVRNLGLRELARRSNLKEAVKATKSKLHQIGGAYLSDKKEYAGWLAEIKRLHTSENRESLLAYLKKIMSYHASMRERLPILEQFYSAILTDLPPIHSVLDIACGFNPLALPWMPLVEPIDYYAYDIYQDMAAFLDEYMRLMQIAGQARVCDLTQCAPTQRVDVAFILKTLPCLEQVDKLAGLRLLQTIQANAIVVSFPIQSLGGRAKGMDVHYEAHFRGLIAETSWSSKRFEFPTELVFLLTRER